MEKIIAPNFTTIDQNGNEQVLENYRGKKVLLYFYPKDMTPGCTLEARGFQELLQEFEKRDTHVLGVSKDTAEIHQKFCDKESLEFPLLLDTDGTIINLYGVWKEKTSFGKKYIGIARESFLIDESGNLLKHWKSVDPTKHPQEVLDFIDSQ